MTGPVGAESLGDGSTRAASLPTGSRAAEPGRSAVDLLLTAARGVRWWVASVMGDNAYARYVQHLAVHHPELQPPTEREYWRVKYAEADAAPVSRCC